MPKEYQRYIYEAGRPKEQVVCDYIAGMTDQFAIDTTKIFMCLSHGKSLMKAAPALLQEDTMFYSDDFVEEYGAETISWM